MKWTVAVSKKADKQMRKLDVAVRDDIRAAVNLLVVDIEAGGPVRGDWPNYSKLSGGRHHCHLNKRGRPTYIAVWGVTNNEARLVEVTHVSTRENAPY